MEINVAKTKCMHICRQQVCTPVSESEARDHAKLTCPHAHCNYVFNNRHGLKVHAAKCRMRDVHCIDKITAVVGDTGSVNRRFKARWTGYGEEEDTWEPYSHLPPNLITEFLLANDLYDHEWPGSR